MDHNLKVRAKPIKVLGENFGVNFHGFGLGIDITPKEKNKLDLTKIKKPFASNDPMEKVKRQFTGWMEIFTSYMPDKGLVHKQIRQIIQFKNAQRI